MLRSGAASLWTVVVETVVLVVGSWQQACTSCLPSLLVSSSPSQEPSSPRSGAAHRADGRGYKQCRSSGGNSARSAETAVTTAAGAAGVLQGAVTTALVDTRLLGKPQTFSGLHADWKSWRFTFTACEGDLKPAIKRFMESSHADTDGEIFKRAAVRPQIEP